MDIEKLKNYIRNERLHVEEYIKKKETEGNKALKESIIYLQGYKEALSDLLKYVSSNTDDENQAFK